MKGSTSRTWTRSASNVDESKRWCKVHTIWDKRVGISLDEFEKEKSIRGSLNAVFRFCRWKGDELPKVNPIVNTV